MTGVNLVALVLAAAGFFLVAMSTQSGGGTVQRMAAPSPPPVPSATPIEIPSPTPAATPSVVVPVPPAVETAPVSAVSPPPIELPMTSPEVVASSAPTQLVVPSVDLNVTVLQLPKQAVINPPSMMEAYWDTDFGSPGSDAADITVVAAHSWNKGDAAFNRLFNQAEQTSRVTPGQEVLVRTEASGDRWLRYVVESTVRYPKSSLAEAGEVWEKVPGRLVLITCFQRNDGGRSTDNFVVTAQFDSVVTR